MKNLYHKLWLFLAVTTAFLTISVYGQTQTETLIPWQGEYFDAKDGGFYFQLKSAGTSSVDVTSRVVVVIENMLSRERYVAAQKFDLSGEKSMPIWKIPAGKYQIQGAILVDGAGRKRQWRQTNKVTFIVKKAMLSNLGVWTLSAQSASDLMIDIKMGPNIYKESGEKSGSSVVAVIDGMSGLSQEIFGGKKLLNAAKNNYGNTGEMRVSYSIRRQISMFFTLQLFQHNAYARQVADVLNIYDPQLRECYSDALLDTDSLRGTVQFKFVLSKSAQSLKSIKNTGGSLTQPKIVKCLFDILAAGSFPVTTNMIGELTFKFDYTQE